MGHATPEYKKIPTKTPFFLEASGSPFDDHSTLYSSTARANTFGEE